MSRGIYCFTNKKNGKKYIGQSINIENRKRSHINDSKNPNCPNYNNKFYRALRKYGINNFDFEIIDSNDNYTREDLNILEQYYIFYYDANKNGYNSTDGGDCMPSSKPKILSIEQVERIKNLIVYSNKTFYEIANTYKVSISLICGINSGKIWRAVGEWEDYPLRKDSFRFNRGGNNPNSILSDSEVIRIRKDFVNRTLDEIYVDWKDKISYFELKKILYGSQFKNLPIYRKYKKYWELNGTRIDYPGLRE